MSYTYATLDDLRAYLGHDPVADSERLLQRAADLLDTVLVGVRFDVDTTGFPTDTGVLAALKNACCAQVEWWVEIGDELRSAGRFQDVSLGPMRLRATQDRSGGYNSRSAEGDLAPRARDYLITAGLIVRPQIW